MRDPAIDDYVATVLATWYSTVAMGDAHADDTTCAACLASPVRATLAAWPHAVVHSLVESIGTVIRAVAISLDEEDFDGIPHDRWAEVHPRPHDHDRQATQHVLARVREHRLDIEDVLLHCVFPTRLSA